MHIADPQAYKLRVASLFDMVADGYDSAALRYAPFCADRLAHLVRIAPGEKVLDVATGTGAVAIAAAQLCGPAGRVMAIDLAERMLERARRNIDKMALPNVDLFDMDGEAPEFRSRYFNKVLCSYALHLMPDMARAVRGWAGVTRPGGVVGFTAFGEGAFQPMLGMFRDQLARYDVSVAEDDPAFVQARLAGTEDCVRLLEQAGLEEVEVRTEPLGYHLNAAADWWEVLWNGPARGLLSQMPGEMREPFMNEHLTEVTALVDEKGLWLNVDTHVASARRPVGG